MKAAIRQRALELGFDDCRFTTAAAPASAEQFQKWIAGKQFGEMAWLERNALKRIDPQQVLPGAKSVICLAASYETPIHVGADVRRLKHFPSRVSLPRLLQPASSPATPDMPITTMSSANG